MKKYIYIICIFCFGVASAQKISEKQADKLFAERSYIKAAAMYEQPGHITICANDSGAFAEVTIEDDGVGMDPEHLRSVLAGHTDGEHVGLRNVDARLRQVYGDEHGLVIETAPGEGTLITMRVPKSQPGHDA